MQLVERLKKELNAAEALARHSKPAQAKLEDATKLVRKWQDVAENFERRVVPSLQAQVGRQLGQCHLLVICHRISNQCTTRNRRVHACSQCAC